MLNNKQRIDPATVSADFQSDLIKLIDVALANHARGHFLVEALDQQITRLRMAAATRPR